MTRARLDAATLAHVYRIAPRMRAADREEVAASDGLRPAQALRASLRGSDFARVLFLDDEPAAMFGVKVHGNGTVGVPWALTTDVVDRRPVAFWKASKVVVAALRARYPVLRQCVDARHARAVAWLARLGFSVLPPHGCGVADLQFHEVQLVR